MNDGWNVIVCYSAVFWVAVGLYIWRRNRPKSQPPQSGSRPSQSSHTTSQSVSSDTLSPWEEKQYERQEDARLAAEARWEKQYENEKEEKARKEEESYERYQEQQEESRRKQEEDEYYDYLDKKKKWEEDNG